MASHQSTTIIWLVALLAVLPVLSYVFIYAPVDWTGLGGWWVGIGLLALAAAVAVVWMLVRTARGRDESTRERSP